jgi:hypothetical protein
MKRIDCAYAVVVCIDKEIKSSCIILPEAISLKKLEELSGCRVQTIGMSYEKFIKPKLLKRGIKSQKTGKPVVLELMER